MSNIRLCIGKKIQSGPVLVYNHADCIYDAISLNKIDYREVVNPIFIVNAENITKFMTEPIFVVTETGWSICCSSQYNLISIWNKLDGQIVSFQPLAIPDIFNLKSMKPDQKQLPRYVLPPFSTRVFLKLRQEVRPLNLQIVENINQLTRMSVPELCFDDISWQIVNYSTIKQKINNDEIYKAETNSLFSTNNGNVIMSFYCLDGRLYLCRVFYDQEKEKVRPPRK